MVGYVNDIERQTKENENFRKVIFTGQHMQLVVMKLEPGEEIGMEVHLENDQFFRVEEGEGRVVMNGEEHAVHPDWAAIVPAGTEHNFINTSNERALKLYTIYAPPHHPSGTVHETKIEAEKAEKEKESKTV
jgi:mannose-6-phosphate isomerase-like protein (cupin superfamily)